MTPALRYVQENGLAYIGWTLSDGTQSAVFWLRQANKDPRRPYSTRDLISSLKYFLRTHFPPQGP